MNTKTPKGFTTDHPGFVYILIDCSGSMYDIWKDGLRKIDVACREANSIVHDFCKRAEPANPVRNVMVCVTGYTTDCVDQNFCAIDFCHGWPETLCPEFINTRDGSANEVIHPPEVATEKDRLKCLTPTSEAFDETLRVVQKVLDEEKHNKGRMEHGFPPIVIHITDGASNDFHCEQEGNKPKPWGSATRAAAERLKQVSTAFGNLVLMNIFIDRQSAVECICPQESEIQNVVDGSRDRAHFLFELSSPVPDYMLQKAARFPRLAHMKKGARTLAITSDPVVLMHLLRWGSYREPMRPLVEKVT